ncbi:MAG: MFS transporter [Microbacteriaceae bacterium]|nr:MFS transporter [Microbacteriaceae bacterium]
MSERPDDRAEERARLEALETGQIPLPAPAAAEPAPRIPAEIWTLLASTFFIAVGFGLIVPVLPQYADSFGVSAFLVTIVVSAFAVMRLAAAPIAGPLVDRLGERPMYIAGLLIVAASSFATAFAGDYWQLLVYRGLGGIGSVMFTIAASSMVVKFSPPAIRGRVSSLWGGMFLIGGISGPFFGGLLAQLGVRVPFIAYGIGLCIAAAIVAVVLGRVQRRRAEAAAAPKAPPMPLAEALALPAYRAALAFGFANGWANMGLRSAVVPLFVSQLLSGEPWAAGAIVAVGAVGNVLALQWAGRASDRLGRRPLILVGVAIAFVGIVLFAITGALWFAFVASFVAGLGSGLSAPAEQAAIADLIGRDRSGGRPLAVFQMSQDVGQIAGPMVAGLIIDAWGYPWAFGAAALVMAVPFVAWLLAPETLRRDAG